MIADDMYPNAPTTVIARPGGVVAIRTPVPLSLLRESRGNPSEGLPGYYIRFLFAGEPPAGRFLCRQRKRRKKPPKGTYFEAVPFGIPPRRRRGLRPLRSPTGDGGTGERGRGRETGDEGYGLPQPVTSVTGFAMTRFYCFVLSLYAGGRRGVAMTSIHCPAHCL